MGDDVKCSGSETSLEQCLHKTVDDCSSGEGAGGICTKLLKLIGGSGPHEGNIFWDGKPVCDDTFTDNSHGNQNAKVVCRMLGYSGGVFTRESHFGRVSDDFSMDDVRCSGTETN